MKSLKYLLSAISIVVIYAAFFFAIYWIAEYLVMNMI